MLGELVTINEEQPELAGKTGIIIREAEPLFIIGLDKPHTFKIGGKEVEQEVVGLYEHEFVTNH